MRLWESINMPAKILLMILIFLPGCGLLRFFKEHPFQIKAVIEGEIKGHKIHCEKNLDVANGKWGVMCSIDNGLDIKYRVRPLTNEQTQVEFLVGKSKDGREKVIAMPRVVVKRAHSARTVTTSKNSYITVVAERIK
jgi:hypothetical protein